MRSDRSVPRRVFRSPLSRLARAGSAAALALMVVTCHSDNPTNVCAVSKLAFTAQPTSTSAGALIAVTVAAQDGSGNTQTCFKGQVTIALSANPGGATLGGTATATASNGVASFSDLSITKAASGYTLTATGGGAAGTSNSFNIAAGAAKALAFSTQPVTTTAGASFTTTVTAQDQYGNPATTFSGGTNTVTVAIGTNGGSPTPGSLSGTKTQTAVNGVATFPGLSIDKAGTNYTLTAAATSLTGATSAAFSINPGAAAALFFTAEPSSGTSGTALSPAVVVTARDAQGNTATGLTGNVTLALTAGTGTPGATLSGGSVAVSGGTATFTALKIDKSGANYTLTATAPGVATGATSAAFNIAPAAASQLAFTIEPSSDTAGGQITPAVVVTAMDAAGNTDTAFKNNVTIAIGTNPGTGALSGTTVVAATAGVSTFSDLSIDKSGNGYTLTASATGLTPDTSNTFNITAGTATQLVFTQSPTTAQSMVAISPTVAVTARDAHGNTATGLTGDVTLTITGGTGTPGATLLGGTAAVAAGVATFPALKIDKSGANYTLTATATDVPAAISTTFNITPAAATRLAFTVQPPNDTAGGVFTPAVKVTALDSVGNTDTSFKNVVTMDFGTNAGGGTLKGTVNRTAAAGVATFDDLSINKSGTGYRLHATSGTLAAATSNPFDITAATATTLAFTVQPGNTAAGAAFVPDVQVSAQDVEGNTNPGFVGNVTVTITPTTGTAGAKLSGGASITASLASGVATFTGADSLSVDLVGQGYTLTATASGLATATSLSFNIIPNVASALVFSVQPANATAGLSIPGTSGNIQVTALDGQGNVATAFAGSVTLTIHTGSGTSGATLRGTATVAANAGVATFTDVRIDKSGANYSLDANAGGTSGATSGTFNIAPGSATQLAFTVQPPATATAAGVALSPAVQVTGFDSLGNVDTTFKNAITVALSSGNANAHLLGGASATTVAAANGVASFPSLRIDSSGSGYTLSASAAGVSGQISGGPSNAFSIKPGTATQLAFTAQPTTATAGKKIAPPVLVTARDSLGNTDTTLNAGITVEITAGSGTSGAHLSGGAAVTATAVAGIATFSGADSLSIDRAGADYTLSASAIAPAIVGGPSTKFNITPDTATHFVFSVQPSDAAAGDSIKPPVQVTALDAFENIDTTFVDNVTMEIGTNPAAGSLGGTTVRTAVKGVATFDDLSILKAGIGYRLLAHDGAMTSPLSAQFTITSTQAKQIAFTVQPGTTTAGVAINPAVVVTAKDSLDNIATGFSGEVKVAISSGGTAGAHFRGVVGDTVRVTANQGVATFSALRIDSAGSGYILSASTANLTAALSTSFKITPGAATQLKFTVQPKDTTAGVAIAPPVKVTALDSLGNQDTTFKTGITVAITANSGTSGAHLLGGPSSTTTTADTGVATFASVRIDSAGSGYTLSASATGVGGPITGGPSSAFSIKPGAAVALVITGQPSNAQAGAAIPVQVTARDSLGNTDTTFTTGISLALAGGNAGAHLLTGASATPVAGVAAFSISVDSVGTGYTIHTTAPFTSAASVPFNITPAAASQLVFTVQPATTTTGATISPAVKVTALDAQGNLVPTFSGNVKVAITSGTGDSAATLSGSATRAAVSGVATFSNLSIDKPDTVPFTKYTLSASAAGLDTGTSVAFDIIPSVADHLVFSVQPSTDTAGGLIAPAVVVSVRDASGQTMTGFVGNVTVAITNGTGTAGAALGGNLTQPVLSGVATFTDLNIDKSGTAYKLDATSSGVPTGATSAAFSIDPASADHLEFTLQPSTTTAGATITPQVEVTARDVNNNVATGFTGNVSLAIHTGTGAVGAVLSGTIPKQASAGLATFSDLSINLSSGSNYQLDASATGLTTATSNAFQVTAAQATHLAFTVQPTSQTAGVAIAPITVTALDSNNVTVTTFTNDVTLTITGGTGTSGATLSGTTTATTVNLHLVNGVATFNDLSIDKTGSGYRLSATASSASGARSLSFAITAATAHHVDFTQQPASTSAGALITAAVTVRDEFGNSVTNFSGTMTVSLINNTTGATLFGTKTVTVVNGVATFTDLQIDKSGPSYRLAASGSGLAIPDTSNAFSITGGTPKQLLFTVQPSTTKANANINPDIRVTALDSLGNVASFSDNVTLTLSGGTGGAALGGATVGALDGVADFSAVTVNKVGTGYVLTASTPTPGVANGTSVSFTITADRLVFTVQPVDPQTQDVAITPAVKVAAQDGFGNTDTTFTNDVTMSKQSGTGGGSLTGTTVVTAVKGVATFDNLIVTAPGTGWSLKASYTPANLTPAISTTFNVN